MVMLRPSDADWWWNVALSGVLGTLIAAIVAIVGVRMALAHDRKLANTAADTAREVAREAAVAAECRHLAREARSLLDRIHDAPPPFLELHAWHREVIRLCNQVFQAEEEFRALLAAASSQFPRTTLDPDDTRKIVLMLSATESVLAKRAAGAEWFKQIGEENLKILETSFYEDIARGVGVSI